MVASSQEEDEDQVGTDEPESKTRSEGGIEVRSQETKTRAITKLPNKGEARKKNSTTDTSLPEQPTESHLMLVSSAQW